MKPNQLLLNSLLCLLLSPFSTSIHIITSNQSIPDGLVLLSEHKNFALGFFTPGNSRYRYVGIWYVKVSEKTVVWVANRDNPINDSSGVLTINAYGDLVLTHPNHDASIWSTNVSISSTNANRVAKLLDTGNLVLVEGGTDKVVWQSFDHPCNTILPGMKLGVDLRSGLNRFLTSWKSPDDPGTGEYSFKLYPGGSPQVFLSKGSTRIWRAGRWPWTNGTWPRYHLTPEFFYDNSFVINENEVYVAFKNNMPSVITRAVVQEAGIYQRFTWHGADRQWKSFYSAPKITCDEYGECGVFSTCNPNTITSFECGCLPGFQPKSPSEWYLRDGSGGCMTKRDAAKGCGDGEGFLKVAGLKLPDTSAAKAEKGWSVEACQEACLTNCSCTAYAVPSIDGKDTVCLTWYGELIDIVEYGDTGSDLYVRVDAIELAEHARKSKSLFQKQGMLAIPILSVAIALLLFIIFSILWLKRRKARDSWVTKVELDESKRCLDLPILCLSTIVSATNNFSSLNKLGQGGFGSVYKGQLPNGQEIAVKRLSKSSGQGTEEFKNEVTLIARLQHRNLVKLLGICIDGEEKILIYEFLANKSLDFFIFDQTRSLLDWRKRFGIIVGIARGILYLHQDSRLRIIHRDLKTSNVLLDAEMNPKISDFGMARIFGGNELQDGTNRIVGTYGYMSPEYAVFGKFSTKSDVFSFGVIVLEIISGKKNSCYFQSDPSLTLTGYVWDLWKEERALDFIDPSLSESYLPHEVLRCIHIGLLCVEERVENRPAMPEVVLMLVGETTLPPPKQPAFVFRRNCDGLDASATRGVPFSVNKVTITDIEAR